MKKIIGLLSLALITFACEEPDNVINDILDNYGTGAVLRTISSSGEYNFYAPDSSVFSATIEEHDVEDGGLMQNVEVYVNLNGGSEALLKTLTPADFTTGPTGLPRTDLTVTLGEAIGALGLNSSQYTGGDAVNIRLQLNLTDGTSFSSDSVTGSMTGSYFKSPYVYSMIIKCIPIGAIPGIYTINLTDTYGDGWNGAFITVTVDGVSTDITMTAANSNGASGSETITIPEGASTMSFSFTGGAWDSEVIYSIDFTNLDGSNAQTALTDGTNPADGEKTLSICQ